MLNSRRHRLGAYGYSHHRSGNGTLSAIGLVFMLFGYVGAFIGQWIRSAISRQREYLADATAVQYTRNPSGIAGALKKIGGSKEGSMLSSPAAPFYSHAYFSKGIASRMFSTHPPLDSRIRRVEPGWDGIYATPVEKHEDAKTREEEAQEKKERKRQFIEAFTSIAVVLEAIERTGQPSSDDIYHAREIIDRIPESLKREAGDPYGARAVMYALLLHTEDKQQNVQWSHLEEHADPQVYQKTRELHKEIKILPRDMRLPLFELSIPAIRSLSAEQYSRFRECLHSIIKLDERMNVQEWIAFRLLTVNVDEAFGLRKKSAKGRRLSELKRELEILLSAYAYIEHSDRFDAENAFKLGAGEIEGLSLSLLPREAVRVIELDKAVEQLALCRRPDKKQILKASVMCLAADGKVTDTGNEVLHVVASSLDCPLPPLPSKLD